MQYVIQGQRGDVFGENSEIFIVTVGHAQGPGAGFASMQIAA